MKKEVSQESKAKHFKALHHTGKILVLPNIWDPLGALLLESLDYPAIATASASVAFTNGYDDGEHFLFDDVLKRLKQIVASVNVPVTADIESGYAVTEEGLEQNIEKLIDTGIAGINLEDYNKETGALFPVDVQFKRISIVRRTSERMKVPLFINARTDVYIKGKEFDTDDQRLKETFRRAEAYLSAGADCIFPLAMKTKSDLATLITELKCPVNVIALPGIPDFKTLQEIGVARVSLGPGFLKIAIKAMKDLATKLKNYEGLDDVIGNEVTSDFLKKLVNRS